MVYHLAGAHRLTVEEARILGRSLGCCMICGATLTDPESVERGIGPICETRVAGTYAPRSGRRNTARSNGATMIAAARDEAARLSRRAPIGLTEDQADSWYQEQALDAEDRAERLEAMQP
jgi:hypothetical protein